MQNSNVIMNWGESEAVAILRSSDSRGRHPRRAPPWIGHAIRHVCEWTHCKWMAGLCWGARFISSNKNAPTGRHLLPLVGGAWSPAGVSHVRESGWMRCVCVCLAVRVTGCVRVQVRTHAETAGKKKKKQVQHLKRSKIDVKGFRDEVLPLNKADPPRKRRWTWENVSVLN